MDYEVTAPDGRKFRVSAPEGASQNDILSYAQKQWDRRAQSERVASQIENDTITQGAKNFAKDMPLGSQVLAGAGSAVQNVVDASKQLVGRGPNAEQVQERRALDAPLMQTAGGLAGNVAGNLTMMAPASLMPGGATVPGAAAVGGILGALQPTVDATERLKNMGIGAALGGGAQWLGTTGATMLGQRAAANEAAARISQAQNAERDAVLEAGRKAGYKVPPSTINPTLPNTAIESLGGKIATQQQFSVANQTVTDTLGRKAIGLQANAPLTDQVLNNMRKAEGQAYEAIKSVPGKFNADQPFAQDIGKIGKDLSQAAQDFPNSTKNAAIENLMADLNIGSWTPRGIMEKVKMLRADASTNFKAFSDPEKLALARAQRQAAEALDGLVERNLAMSGQGNMAAEYQAARRNIAKLHDIQSALTPGGHIDARVLAKIGENQPLSGELKTIADFAGNFPKAVQTGEKVGSPMVHALRPSIGSAVGGVIGGVPGAAVGAATGVAVPWLARGAMLSGPGQSLMATPSYSAGLISAAAQRGLLPGPEMGGLLLRSTVPAGYMALQN
jgi:hypothetical protein